MPHRGAPPIAALAVVARLILVSSAISCGGGGSSLPVTGPTPPAPSYAVQSVTDGDTIRITPALAGASSVRFLNIDAPEIGGATQEPWATESRDHLRALLPGGTAVTLALDRETMDSFGRILAYVIRQSDSLDVNREQLRLGHAVTYTLWPNVARIDAYRSAQIEAQDQERAVWNPARLLRQLPFEYRLGGARATRPAGDFRSRFFVDAQTYPMVPVNNRVFFSNDVEALGAGYTACPRDSSGMYSASCFAPPR